MALYTRFRLRYSMCLLMLHVALSGSSDTAAHHSVSAPDGNNSSSAPESREFFFYRNKSNRQFKTDFYVKVHLVVEDDNVENDTFLRKVQNEGFNKFKSRFEEFHIPATQMAIQAILPVFKKEFIPQSLTSDQTVLDLAKTAKFLKTRLVNSGVVYSYANIFLTNEKLTANDDDFYAVSNAACNVSGLFTIVRLRDGQWADSAARGLGKLMGFRGRHLGDDCEQNKYYPGVRAPEESFFSNCDHQRMITMYKERKFSCLDSS